MNLSTAIATGSHEGIRAAIRRFSLFDNIPFESILIEQLGGLTNSNFKLISPIGCHVLRLVGIGEGQTIDREKELHNLRIAEHMGFTLDVVAYDIATGSMVTVFNSDAVTLFPPSLREKPQAITAVGKVLRRLHGLDIAFRGTFDVYEQTAKYVRMIRQLGQELPPAFVDCYPILLSVRKAITISAECRRACHVDTVPENFLFDGSGVLLIDFEYSASADPMWDLANFSVESSLSVEGEKLLLESYFDGAAVPPDKLCRFLVFKVLSDVCWSLCGIVHHANGNPSTDWAKYATDRMNQATDFMKTAAFNQAMLQLKLPMSKPQDWHVDQL